MAMLIHDRTSASWSRRCAPYIVNPPRCRRPLPPHCNMTILLTWMVTHSPPPPTRTHWAYYSDWSLQNITLLCCSVSSCQCSWHWSGIHHSRHKGGQGHNQKLICGEVFSSVPFLLPSFPSPIFSPLWSGPSSDLGSAVCPPAGEDDSCSHQTCSLGSEYAKTTFAAEPRPQVHFYVFWAQGTCLVAANVVPFLLNEI